MDAAILKIFLTLDFIFSNILTLSNFGNIASIIGVIVTILVFLRVKKIHLGYLFKIRGPIIVDKLRGYSDNILIYLNDIDSYQSDLTRDLRLCTANLKNLRKKVPKDIRKTIKMLDKKINKYISMPSSYQVDYVRGINNDIQALIEECLNLREDLNWSNE